MFPHLLEAVHWIALANEFTMKGGDPTWFDNLDHWPPETKARLEWFDWLCGRMRGNELELFCTGDDETAKKIADKHNCHDLHEFLNRVYEGEYFNYFFIPPGSLCNEEI